MITPSIVGEETNGKRKVREVKNLGWLLRHWQDVKEFGFMYAPNGNQDGVLTAWLKNGGCYQTGYASLNVCWNWLQRPVFIGQTLTLIDGRNLSKMPARKFEIGSPEFKRINRLEYWAFFSAVGLELNALPAVLASGWDKIDGGTEVVS